MFRRKMMGSAIGAIKRIMLRTFWEHYWEFPSFHLHISANFKLYLNFIHLEMNIVDLTGNGPLLIGNTKMTAESDSGLEDDNDSGLVSSFQFGLAILPFPSFQYSFNEMFRMINE
jgi:hypothetical protein